MCNYVAYNRFYKLRFYFLDGQVDVEGSAFLSKQVIDTVTSGNNAELYEPRVYSARDANNITQPRCLGIFRWCF